MSGLGKLRRLPLQYYWKNEAADFTPWLAEDENLELLGQQLQVSLSLIGIEKRVGPFRADIVCKEAEYGNQVIIENQLFTSDHKHLGQLMTYAASLSACKIIWIASGFAKEHTAAIDWLNDSTNDGIEFFAVAVELFQIDQSRPAPFFSVICAPNGWRKSLKNQDEASLVDVETASEKLGEFAKTLNVMATANLGFPSGQTIFEFLESVEQRGGKRNVVDANRILSKIGLRLVIAETGLNLAVANSNRGLEKVFKESPWADGRWREILCNVPGAKYGNPRSFAGQQSRATEMSLREFLLLKPNEGN